MPTLKRKGFTLFELLIVILILAVIYAFVLQNFSFSKSKDSLTLSALPEYLKKNFAKTKQKVVFRCFGDCLECKIYIGKNSKDVTSLFVSKNKPTLYFLTNGRFEHLELGDFYENESYKELCFEYTLYPNKSSDKILLEYDEKFYLYDNLFEKTKLFSSLEEARAFIQKQSNGRFDDL